MGFVVMIIWMFPFLNPPAQEDQADPPGNVIVHITWPIGNNDVDLWVMGPGEVFVDTNLSDLTEEIQSLDVVAH